MGKTTLARALYNRLKPWYPGCKASAVYEQTWGQDLDEKAMFCDLAEQLGLGHLHSLETARPAIAKTVTQGGVLLLLDNLDSSMAQRLVNFSPEIFQPGPDGVTIITSRDQTLPSRHSASQGRVYWARTGAIQYQMLPMAAAAASELFEKKAGKRSAEFKVLETKFLEVCQGMPLAVELIAAGLRDSDLQGWKAVYEELAAGIAVGTGEPENLHNHMQGVLTWSLKRLAQVDDRRGFLTKMFFDAACVLAGEPETTARLIWRYMYNKEYGVAGDDYNIARWLNRLQERCLLRVEDGKIWVHDILIALSRSYACVNQELVGRRAWSNSSLATEVRR
eukprot:GHUV01015730.1.p1 GENE.GHUV01015730.1~~GHUV01015730.1.p1  ORF type:complete len:335 (+),score=60.92 GHUV01015730.1:870-1874(+)